MKRIKFWSAQLFIESGPLLMTLSLQSGPGALVLWCSGALVQAIAIVTLREPSHQAGQRSAEQHSAKCETLQPCALLALQRLSVF